MAYEARYVFRPNPGADMAVITRVMERGRCAVAEARSEQPNALDHYCRRARQLSTRRPLRECRRICQGRRSVVCGPRLPPVASEKCRDRPNQLGAEQFGARSAFCRLKVSALGVRCRGAFPRRAHRRFTTIWSSSVSRARTRIAKRHRQGHERLRRTVTRSTSSVASSGRVRDPLHEAQQAGQPGRQPTPLL